MRLYNEDIPAISRASIPPCPKAKATPSPNLLCFFKVSLNPIYLPHSSKTPAVIPKKIIYATG